MSSGDEYRTRAAEIRAQALCESHPRLRAGYENLALAYLRLAEQADRNATTDLVIETRSDGAPIVHLQAPHKDD